VRWPQPRQRDLSNPSYLTLLLASLEGGEHVVRQGRVEVVWNDKLADECSKAAVRGCRRLRSCLVLDDHDLDPLALEGCQVG
jgi:hypothetical protein